MSYSKEVTQPILGALSVKDTSVINNAVLQRLIEEVKQEKNEISCVGGRYDRTHNKHNR